MIFTSYYNKAKNLEGFHIAVSQTVPAWFKPELYLKELAPPMELVVKFKEGQVDKEEFVLSYVKSIGNEGLRALSSLAQLCQAHEELGIDTYILCHCGKDKACHRQIIALLLWKYFQIRVTEYSDNGEDTLRKVNIGDLLK